MAKSKPKKKLAPARPRKPAPRPPRTKAPAPAADDYAAYRDRQAGISRQRSQKGREIGELPPIEDLERRERCRASLRLFCETYNPEAFRLRWSKEHLRAIERIEEAALLGALFALAMPRGAGKTTICRMASLWVLSYAIRRYVYIVAANADKAEDALASLKIFVRFLPTYAADFPEISYPAQALAGIANRASGQTCGGESTLIEWQADRIVLPTVPPPPNWPAHWPLRKDGKVPTSGVLVSASGLTGEGIRGSLKTLTTGEMVRPDFVLLDDPQTSESAASGIQNVTRERLVGADVLGMAGPDCTIAAVMPCTVIARGDMVDNLLDRKKHPAWRGERTSLLRSMPTDLGAWERYREVYERCLLKEPPDLSEANAYYLAHRAELDAGAEASWPERKLPQEISAVQYGMHLYFRDKAAFWSEYQNSPLPTEAEAVNALSAEAVTARVNGHARGRVPDWATRLTAFVDVQKDLLWWCVCGWAEGFGGSVLAYGAWPEQGRPYYTLADARPTISAATGIGSLEGSLRAALDRLADEMLARDWPREGGGALQVERCLVDSGWGQSTDVVKRFCRESGFRAVLTPSKGVGIGASATPIADWPKQQGERRGADWLLRAPKAGGGRVLLYDANAWKSFCQARLTQPVGEKGALVLCGDDPKDHRLLADHLCAEYQVRTSGRGRELDEWKLRPHRPDNHLLDCLVGCCVAASFQGLSLEGASPPKKRKRVSYKQMQAERQQKRAA